MPDDRQDQPRRLTRLTVNLSPRTADALQLSMQREELSRTDVVNRAVHLYNFLMAEAIDGGKELMFHDAETGQLQLIKLL